MISKRDRDFLCRVYAQGLNKYRERLQSMSFVDMGRVLDAGCGFGQWSIALACLNDFVVGVDVDYKRCYVSTLLKNHLRILNLCVSNTSITDLPFKSSYFDGIFCFSVIYQTEILKSLEEFYRVLKKGGRLYINTNGLGWYIYNLLKKHNPSEDFNPRFHALRSILKSYIFRCPKYRGDWIINPKKLKKYLEIVGFKDVVFSGDGFLHKKLRKDVYIEGVSFYRSRFLLLTNVYEIMGKK
ncbi:MAG: class I SAM-dependent methyltransferase [Candidatus Hodarchaeota archaeon]